MKELFETMIVCGLALALCGVSHFFLLMWLLK
jgi:hypothetical protein